jgi:hypothetical protein
MTWTFIFISKIDYIPTHKIHKMQASDHSFSRKKNYQYIHTLCTSGTEMQDADDVIFELFVCLPHSNSYYLLLFTKYCYYVE